jgi:hypothetical protein
LTLKVDRAQAKYCISYCEHSLKIKSFLKQFCLRKLNVYYVGTTKTIVNEQKFFDVQSLHQIGRPYLVDFPEHSKSVWSSCSISTFVQQGETLFLLLFDSSNTN